MTGITMTGRFPLLVHWMLQEFCHRYSQLAQPQGDAATEPSWRDSVTSWAANAQESLRDTLGPPLRSIQEPIDAWLGSLPMWVAMSCAIGLYVLALIWTWFIPRNFIWQGARDQAAWRDLRIWATLVILPYIAVYLWLGR